MKVISKLMTAALCALATVSLVACGGNKTTLNTKTNDGSNVEAGGNAASGEEKEMKFLTYLAGENVGAKFMLPQVERFNTLYEGKYRIEIEEIPQNSYGEKIKQLAQQNKLPALVHASGSGGLDVQWFQTVAIPNGMAYDLTEFIESNEYIKDIIIEESLEYCTVDGKVICMPISIIRPNGIFYNSTMYNPEKPIHEMSVDEFIASLGDNKIAFQTADNAWTTGLLLTAMIADEEGGVELLQDNATDKLYEYNHPAIVNALEKMRTLIQSNGASNTVGAAYADAANAFMSGNASLICNGPWMSSDFASDASDKWSNDFDGADVRADLLPGNIGIANPKTYGNFWISTQASDDEIEVAKAFLAFRMTPEEQEALMLAEGGSTPNMSVSDSFANELAKTPVLADFDKATTVDTTFVPNFMSLLPTSISDEEFGKMLPKLIDGSMSAEEFCVQLTEKAQTILE